MKETALTLEIMGGGPLLPPFSARECTQTLTLLPQGVLRRTINGDLIWVGHKGHQKYQSTISCKDKASPAFDSIWRGALLKVRCLQTLTQPIDKEIKRVQLDREAGAFFILDKKGKIWSGTKEEDRWIAIPSEFPGGFITYHPQLMMMIKSYTLETDEWGLSVGWTLELEEV